MNTSLIKNAIDAFKGFVAALGNDVCNNAEENEYTVFSGQISADNKGNIKTYALINNDDAETDEPKKVLVAQVPLRPILDNLADFAKSMVDLYEADKTESESKAQAREEAEAAEIEAENADIQSKISDLQSEIRSLKLQKKSVHYVKRF